MMKSSIHRFPAAVLAALALTLLPACEEQPTAPGAYAGPEVAFTYIGYPGVAGDAPASATSTANALVFPSTNVANIAAGWANVTWNASDAGLGEAPLKFTQPRSFAACFEIRIDDGAAASATHYNTPITDGLWTSYCVGGAYGAGPVTQTFNATSHVDVRMSFGAEGDERFDWTRFYVMSVASKDACHDGGWQTYGFANQGQCIRYVETGKQ